MLFNSLSFLVFLPVVLILYIFGKPAYRRPLILISSYIFYSFWDWRFTGLLIFTTFFDYYSAQLIFDRKPLRNVFLALSLSVNLGVLFFFKYFNFFAENLVAVFGFQPGGIFINVILPVGVSFYTLQAISYVIDVWRGLQKPERNLIDFASYIAFFPQLVAGPIERAENLLPQVKQFKLATRSQVETGLALMFLGFFKKVFLGDTLAPLVDGIFLNPNNASVSDLWLGALGFTCQIYFDFAGYTDIARGVALFFGVKLMTNFQQPYLQTNITSAWRAWHISLSSWIRDYIYFPMGGSRASVVRVYFNILFSMIVVGFWHGANWTFIVFGCLHGLYLCFHKLIKQFSPFRLAKIHWSFGLILTQSLVVITYVLFRAPDLPMALDYYGKMFSGLPFYDLNFWIYASLIVAGLLLVDLPALYFKTDAFLELLPKPYRYPLYFFLSIFLVVLLFERQNAARPFIYFQF